MGQILNLPGMVVCLVCFNWNDNVTVYMCQSIVNMLPFRNCIVFALCEDYDKAARERDAKTT